MRLLDVRHEQTAAFAAEATGKLTRVPGLAVLTAGPGVTNGVSAIAQAQFDGSPMVVVGGRAPADRWGTGALQELDQPPILDSITKQARTLHTAADVAAGMDDAFTAARSSHRGPVFVDVPMDEFFNSATGPASAGTAAPLLEPDGDDLAAVAAPARRRHPPAADPGHRRVGRPRRGGRAALRRGRWASRPSPTAWAAASSPAGTRCWSPRPAEPRIGGADLVVVVGTPLDFRLGYGVFGGKEGATPARVVHVADSPAQLSRPRRPRRVGGRRPHPRSSTASSSRCSAAGAADWSTWAGELGDVVKATVARDNELLMRRGRPRSTRPASTASWCPGSPTTPW